MKVFLVGGAVRDELLGIPVKERDWVVVGATPEALRKQGFRPVGKEFPVFLHPQTREEYALARAEKKVAPGYHGFVFSTDTNITLEEDLFRRDLTINAMARDEDGSIIDPYGGQADIENKLLRHVSKAFAEDPVRVLRVARFCARYASRGFHVESGTLDLMRTMIAKGEISALVPERVWQEFHAALSEPMPSMFFKTLREVGALQVLAPDLEKVFAQQEEGMCATLDRAAVQTFPSELRPELMFSIVASWAARAQISLQAWCETMKAPKKYRRLARLLPELNALMLPETPLEGKAVWQLFKKNDLIRNPDRFYQLEPAWEFYAFSQAVERCRPMRSALEAILQLDFKTLAQKSDSTGQIQESVRSVQIQVVQKALESSS